MKKYLLCLLMVTMISAGAIAMSGGAENTDEYDYSNSLNDPYDIQATEEVNTEEDSITYELSPEEDIYMLQNNEDADEQNEQLQGTDETATED